MGDKGGQVGVEYCPGDTNPPANREPTKLASFCLKAVAPTGGWQIVGVYVYGYGGCRTDTQAGLVVVFRSSRRTCGADGFKHEAVLRTPGEHELRMARARSVRGGPSQAVRR
ncbi:MAG: hypothetical protein ACLP01_11160 [Solirubrobacteraceae bacterium]